LDDVESENPFMAIKTVSILGATGSIGDSTLDVIRHHKDQYSVKVLTAGSNIDKLIQLAKEFEPEVVACADTQNFQILKDNLPNTEIMSVADAAAVESDWTMAAIVGTAGLVPTMNAVKRGRTVAFASKECLVAAGDLMMDAVKNCGTTLLPVDSEHNAIFQVFDNSQRETIERLILTASGGPFRTTDVQEFSDITPEQALKHPTWSMGAKISIDSATLMNKALEVIEAHYLFNMPSHKIDVVVHPQSLIHSCVEYNDGSILSQMGPSDMRTPIAYCLGYPRRIQTSGQKLDFKTLSTLTFEEPDTDKFQSLSMVRDVLDRGQDASIVFNAANEVAVAAFLNNQIPFTGIYDVIKSCLDSMERSAVNSLDDVMALDILTRYNADQFIYKDKAKTHYA
jgi:1-deoxy-D-xylulose-5-phosphate reductoisomerase